MFPPDSPPPSKYQHRKRPTPIKKEEGTPILIRVLQIVFILFGIGAIAGMVLFGPKQKHLICDKNMQVHGSLTAFGSCTEEE
jgi:hypothetical protein